MKEKRAVLDGVAAEMRRIIDEPEETRRVTFLHGCALEPDARP